MMKQPQIMGIINLTPDSFSDGGKFMNPKLALRQAVKLQNEGADILDLGAEATGPNSINISEAEEIERLIPTLKIIKKEVNIPISVDTYKAKIADLALQEGATYINDITAFRGDKNMAKIISKHKAKAIIMYSKDKTARTTIKRKRYQDIIKEINNFFNEQIIYARTQGLKKSQIIIDPGMGHYISAIPRYSYEIISRLKELQNSGQEILIGISRKSFLGGPLNERDSRGLPLAAIAYFNGAGIIRTHNVKATKEFFDNLN